MGSYIYVVSKIL